MRAKRPGERRELGAKQLGGRTGFRAKRPGTEFTWASHLVAMLFSQSVMLLLIKLSNWQTHRNVWTGYFWVPLPLFLLIIFMYYSSLAANMKPAWPWMLAHLKIIWQFHAHPVHQKVSRFFWAEIYWGQLFFRAESSLIQSSCRSFIRVIVPYEISKVNFRVETKILVSMSEEI